MLLIAYLVFFTVRLNILIYGFLCCTILVTVKNKLVLLVSGETFATYKSRRDDIV